MKILDGIPAFVYVIIIFAVIALVAFIIYKIINPKSKEHKIDEKQAAKEELDRLLVDVEDEKLSKQINEYKNDEDEDNGK